MRFDAQTRGEIVGALRSGITRERSCYAANVSDRQLRRWLVRGRQEAAEGRDTAYTRFLQDVSHAEAESLANVESRLWDFSKEEWRAAAWILERRDPERYGPHAHERVELRKQVARELFDFLQLQAKPETISELFELLSTFGDTELDPKVLPVPA